jgi:hypothetical protein
LHVAFVVEFRHGVRRRRKKQKTDNRQEKDERDAMGGRHGSEAGGKVDASARSRHPDRFAVDDEIGGGRAPRRAERDHPGHRRRGAEGHRDHADGRGKEFVIPAGRIHIAARVDGRRGVVGGVAVRNTLLFCGKHVAFHTG